MKIKYLACFVISTLFLSTTLLASGNAPTSQRFIVNVEVDLEKSIKAHARYFGFADTKSYLHFVEKLEEFYSGRVTLAAPYSEDPRYYSTLGSNRDITKLSQKEKDGLKDLVIERQNILAKHLGVETKDVAALVESYMAYEDLQKSILAKRDGVSKFSEEDEEDSDMEIIEVTATIEQQNGGILLNLVIADMAEAAGIPMFQHFYVYWQSSGTYQKFKWNSHSGAMSISGKLSCIGDHCEEPPTIPQN